ncbi:IclR family transcriptional regulator [Naasia lichenicola]|uniref:IclR family transcriptional regulator n=1 Tax=Naasia lichenicola TaxID=2565933 RepID=A0A4S4FMG2_9MICO|nr:IclR family transcriptional regulator [Naasia lichenicola]THG31623.1 IclR family transcriptional regulator [Naasia lichenicola]
MSSEPSEPGQRPRSRYRIEALAKGLQVLSLFDETTTALRLGDIVERTGIPMPTAFRIVATLEDDGYIDRTSDGLIQPGLAVLALGSAALRGSSLTQLSEQPLRRLAEATGETVNLGTLTGDRVLYLLRFRNADLVTATIQVGSTLPAIYTSMGKLLLASLDPADLDERIADSFDGSAGPNATGSRADLDRRLAVIRRDGYALQDEELAAGLRSVAVGVTGADGRVVAAINVAVSSARASTERLVQEILPEVQRAARSISDRLRAL